MDRSGSASSQPFAHYVPPTSSSRTSQESEPRAAYAQMQESLLSEWSSPTWPRSAIGGRTTACELPTWARLTDATDGSASPLLPTPSATESTPTDEYVEEFREAIDPDDPHHRLWLPGRKWMAQRTLSRTAAALLPTPRVTAERSSRKAMVENQQWSAPSLAQAVEIAQGILPREFDSWDEVPGRSREGALLPTPRTNDGTGTFPLERPEDMDNLATRVHRHLLPTPTASDSRGKSAGWEGREGGPDLAAAVEPLLPTPTAWLGRRPENATADPERAASREHAGSRGKRSVELPEALAAEVKLMPTPTAMDAAGSRNSTARRRDDSTGNPGDTLTDAVWKTVGAPEWALVKDGTTPLLPTPVANPENPGAGGELRAALTHGPDRRNETGTDTMGRPNAGRPKREELLPTPTTEPATGNGHARNLAKEAKLLPTPLASDGEKGGPGQRFGTGSETLTSAVRGDEVTLLPTPQAADGDGGRMERGASERGWKRPSGAKAAKPLGTAVVLEMEKSHGASTSPPSEGGSTSSDDPPQDQLTIADA
jgi:hypothetical protein